MSSWSRCATGSVGRDDALGRRPRSRRGARPGPRGRFDAPTTGETVALLGPERAGKSTVVDALAGLVPLDDGRSRWRSTSTTSASTRTSRRSERPVGVCFQDRLLFPRPVGASENVAFPLRARGGRQPTRGARRARDELLARLAAGRRPGRATRATCPAVRRQRVALARALVERTAAAAARRTHWRRSTCRRRAEIRPLLRRPRRRSPGCACWSTHDPVEALTLADRVVVLERGQTSRRRGTPDEIRDTPRTRVRRRPGRREPVRGLARPARATARRRSVTDDGSDRDGGPATPVAEATRGRRRRFARSTSSLHTARARGFAAQRARTARSPRSRSTATAPGSASRPRLRSSRRSPPARCTGWACRRAATVWASFKAVEVVARRSGQGARRQDARSRYPWRVKTDRAGVARGSRARAHPAEAAAQAPDPAVPGRAARADPHGLRPGAVDQDVPVAGLLHPVGFDGAHAACRATACWCSRSRTTSTIPGAATSSCSKTPTPRRPPDRGVVGGFFHWLFQGLGRAAARERGLHQAGDRLARRHGRGPRTATSTSTARSSTSRTSRRRPRTSTKTTVPAGPALRDGRQPRQLARLPVRSGVHPARQGDRQGRGHHLAAASRFGRAATSPPRTTLPAIAGRAVRAHRAARRARTAARTTTRSPRCRTPPATRSAAGRRARRTSASVTAGQHQQEQPGHRPDQGQARPGERRREDRQHQQADPRQHHDGRGLRLQQRDARLVRASAYARNVAIAASVPAGIAKRSTRLHEPGPEPVGVRRERQEERRDADREGADQREVPRQERERRTPPRRPRARAASRRRSC